MVNGQTAQSSPSLRSQQLCLESYNLQIFSLNFAIEFSNLQIFKFSNLPLILSEWKRA
jgi:hypothetical protein